MSQEKAQMNDKKEKIEISSDVAAMVLFQADRTCCVCRQRGRPVQLHHVDGDPSNSVADNLAVLCFDCHRETQVRGGFDRKLDAAQVRIYKKDWNRRVETKRNQGLSPSQPESTAGEQILRYCQMREKSEEHFYDFEADYVLVGSADSAADLETNVCINAFVTNSLQRFRANSIATTDYKEEMRKSSFRSAAWDSLVISHNVSLYTPDVLSLEFQIVEYGAGAAHPNSHTKTMNFTLRPSKELCIEDLFKPSSNYLGVLSDYCITNLHSQQPLRWHNPEERARELKDRRDDWILSGARPESRNYQRISLRKHGVVIHFDPYSVGSYAEGKYEVFVPSYILQPIIEERIAVLLGGRP
jgi:hypothetical protein